MPELPEVHTMAFALNYFIQGKEVLSFARFSKKLRKEIPDDSKLLVFLKQKIIKISRLEKGLKFDFGIESFLRIHLGMTGYFKLKPFGSTVEKHEHFRINLLSDESLCYLDPRKFGMIWIADKNEKTVSDPLDQGFTSSKFEKLISSRTKAIKSVLMDQKIVAGIGNIYANEALFRSKIHPSRPANSLARTECKILLKNIKSCLKAAIKSGEAEFLKKMVLDENLTHFPIETLVYAQKDQKCPVCHKATIQKINLQNRGTFFCPNCQQY